MAINTIQGFNPSTTEPIDSRVTVANETARLAFATFNVYEGLIVYQEDTDELYVLNDAENPDQTSSWSTVGGGSGFPFTGSASISGSLDVVGNTYLQDAYLEQHLYHAGDTNTYLRFDNDQIRLIAANYTVFDTTGYSGTIKIGATNNPQDIYLQNDAGVGLFLQKTTGNIGIGTTSPAYKLAVDGNIQLPSGGFIYGQSTGNYLKLDNATYVELGYSSTTAIRADGSDVTIRGVGGTANMTINSGGNVGIGTTSPAQKLHVAGGDIQLDSGKYIRWDGALGIKKVSNNAMYFYAGTHSTNGGFNFATWNGSTYDEGTVVIRNNGNVGIGTTSPSQKLHVDGNIRVGDANDVIYSNRFTTLSNSNLLITANTGYDTTFTNGGSERMRITSTGNVGIGTTSPQYPLHVAGDLGVSEYIKHTGDDNTNIRLLADRLQLNAGGNTVLDYDESGTSTLDIAPEGKADVDILNGTIFVGGNQGSYQGNVGIGTTSPSTTLHVSGSGGGSDVLLVEPAGAPTVSLKSNSTLTDYSGLSVGNKYLLLTKNSGAIFQNIQGGLRFANGLAAKSVITEAGYLGIGHNSVNTVNYPLDVSGSANISGDLVISDTISTPNNVSLRLEPSGSTGQIFFGSPSDGTILYHYSRANNGDTAYYNFDGGYYVITTNESSGIKLNNDVLVSGDLTVTGKVTAEEFHTEFVSASIIYQSGSTKFGDTLDDTHSFTGSLEVSGSTSVSNKLFIGTGSFTTDKDLSIKVSNDVNGGIEVIRTNNIQKLRIGYGSITAVSEMLSLRGDGVRFNLNSPKSSGDAFTFTKTGGRRLTDADAEQAWISAVPDIGQSGTANYVGILLDVTETSLGSGTNYLTDLRVGGSSKFNVTNDGKVGIGTTSPATKIDVDGTGRITDTVYLSTNANSKVGIGTSSPASKLHIIHTDASLDTLRVGRSDNSSYWRVNHAGNDFRLFNGDTSGADILFGVDSGGFIKNNRVGIQVANPTAQLHISSSGTPFKMERGGYDTYGFVQSAGNGLQVQNFTDARTEMFFKGDGNVGIGTTSPGSILHLYQNDSLVGTSAGITIEQDGTGDALLQFLLTAAKRWVVGIDNSDDNKFKIADSTDLDSNARFTIDNTDGNVGIGTTSPSEKLEVVGNTLLSGSLTVSGSIRVPDNIKIEIGDDRDLDLYHNGTNTVIANATGELIFGSPSYRFKNNTLSGDFLTITSAGRVGIGTTNPSQPLHVNGNGRFGGDIYINGQILRSDSTGTKIGFDSNVIRLHTNTSERMRIDSSGNVGIGTTNPTGSLQLLTPSTTTLRVDTTNSFGRGLKIETDGINQNLTSDGGIFSIIGKYYPIWEMSTQLVIPQQYFYGGGVNFRKRGTTDNLIEINLENSASPRMLLKGSGTTSSTTALRVENSNGDVGIQVLDNGNVGIGTTSPSASLSIGDGTTSNVNVYLNKKDNNAAGYYVVNEGNAAGRTAFIRQSSGEDAEVGTSSTNNLSFLTNDTVRVHIDGDNNNGNVGIGTTSPVRLLHLSASDTAINPNLLIEQAGTGNASIGFKLAGSTEFNMGIDNADGNKFKIHRNYAVGGSGNVLTIDGSNNVGIGTTSPAATLDVAGNINTTGNITFDGGAGSLNGLRTINRTGEIRINTTQGTRFGETSLSSGQVIVDIIGKDDRIPLGIKQQVGTSQTRFVTFLSSSGAEVMGITTDGGFIASTDTLVKRFSYSHAYSGSHVSDGQGVGISLITDDSSNNLRDIAYIDAVQDDISEDESSLRFSVGETTPTEVMRLQSDGKVGIGTTTPNQKLHIQDGNLEISPSGSGNYPWTGLSLGFGRNLPTKVGLFGASDGKVQYSDGNLYISTRNVNQGNGSYIQLGQRDSDSATAKGTIILQAGTYNVNGQTGDIFFKYGAGDQLTLKGSTGNVGIGTTSPGYKLEVNGSARFSGETRVAYDNPVLKLIDGNTTIRYAALHMVTNGGTWRLSSGDSNTGTGTNASDLWITRADDGSDNRFRFYRDSYAFGVYSGSNANVVLDADGNSYFNGGNVGIGNTNPTHTVEIGTDGGGEKILKMHSDTASSYFEIQSLGNVARLLATNNTNLLLQSDGTGGYITFNANSAERMRISPSGNVGIGTTSPNAGLHVYSTTGIRSESTGNASIQIMRNDNVQYSALLRYYSGNSEKWVAGLSDAGDYTGSTGEEYIIGTLKSNPLVVLKNDGKLGIGTTSPSEKLQVNGNIAISGSNATLQLREGSAELYKFTAGGSSLDITVNSTNALTVFQSGNVGIGTTSPGRKLTVAGTDNLLFLDSSGNSYLTIDRSATNRRSALVFSTAGDGTSNIPDNIDWALGSADSDEVGDGTGFFIGTNTAATSAKLFISSSGNVGIGTTSPYHRVSSKVSSDNSYAYYAANSAGSNRGGIYIDSNGNSELALRTGAGHKVSLKADGTSYINGGNVGIGTTSPDELFDVAGWMRSENLTVETSAYIGSSIAHFGDGDTNITFNNDDITFYAGNVSMLTINENGTQDKVVVNSNGNDIDFRVEGNADEYLLFTEAATNKVGIGTTSPTAKLHVSGAADVLLIEGSGSTSNTSIFAIDGNNGRLFEVSDDLSDSLFSVNTVAGLPVVEVFADNRVTMGAFNQNDFVISGSKVGIGTSTPVSLLTLEGAVGGDPMLRLKNTGTATSEDAYMAFNRDNTNNQGYTIGLDSGDNSFKISEDGDSITGNNRVTILTGGNVGIGTTSPQRLFDVNGDVRVKRNIYGADGNYIGFFVDGGSAIPIKARSLALTTNFTNNAPTNGLYVQGDVGIGVLTPAHKLDVSGSINHAGASYIVPATTSGASGATTVLTGATFDNATLIKASHDGVSTGNYTLELPAASSSTNRTIRIISDSSTDANHNVVIVPTSGDTLDGGTSGFTINRNYEGLMVWSDGTEWFVIQSKNV